MLPLNIVFLVLISLIVLIVVASLVFDVKLFSFEKILVSFGIIDFEDDVEGCVTRFVSNYGNLDSLCDMCYKIGKKIKRSCYCFVVYSKNINYSKCENRCSKDGVWLIRFSLPENKVIIEC